MNEPREPGTPEEPGISLPSWVDDAISKSRTRPSSESDPFADAGPAAEMAVNPPEHEEPFAPPPEFASSTDPDSQAPVVVARSPRDARRRAVLPWVALALLFAGAALVLGYILLTRPPQQ